MRCCFWNEDAVVLCRQRFEYKGLAGCNTSSLLLVEAIRASWLRNPEACLLRSITATTHSLPPWPVIFRLPLPPHKQRQTRRLDQVADKRTVTMAVAVCYYNSDNAAMNAACRSTDVPRPLRLVAILSSVLGRVICRN